MPGHFGVLRHTIQSEAVELSAGVWFPVKAALFFAIAMIVVWRFRRTDHPFARFGAANQVTTIRLALVGVIAALIGEPSGAGNAAIAAATATVVAILDGADGWIARRTRMSSQFGARFDMEVDALLIMALSVLAWQFGKAGAWVLLSGLLRYIFIAAGWIWPWMRDPLPPSRRRQTICVVQVAGLIVAVAPIITPPLSTLAAAAALLVLAYSFVIDTVWLWRHGAPAQQAA
jgi:phosphatidylglycerophosphate synthase